MKNTFLRCDTTTFRTILLEALNTHSMGRVFDNQKTYTYYELVWHKNRDQEREREGEDFRFYVTEKTEIQSFSLLAKFNYLYDKLTN